MARGRHRRRRDFSPYKPVAAASAVIFAVTGIAIGSVMIGEQRFPSSDHSLAPPSTVEIPPKVSAPNWSARAMRDPDLRAEVMPTTTTPKPAPLPPVVPSPASKVTTPPPAPPAAPKPPPAPAPVAAKIGIGAGWQAQWAVIHAAFPAATLTSAQRCTDTGYHCKGRAIDIAGSPALMLQIDRWIAANYPNSTELIYMPGISLWHGINTAGTLIYSLSTLLDHRDHVHWAM